MTDPQNHENLSTEERLVLDVVKAEGAPLDAIAISGRTRMAVERVLEIVESLIARGELVRVDPEPVHNRVSPSAPHHLERVGG